MVQLFEFVWDNRLSQYNTQMLKYISIGSICSKSRNADWLSKISHFYAKIPIFVQLMIGFLLLVASVHEFARRNKKIVCTNIFHEQPRCPQVLYMFKKLRMVQVRHLLHLSSDNLLKCVAKKVIPLVSVSSFKKTLENNNFAVLPPEIPPL